MDRQAQEPTEAEPADAQGAAASGTPRESESGFMNSLIRRVSGWMGSDDEASGDAEEQPADQPGADAQPTVEQPAAGQQPTQRTYSQDEFDRAVQSAKDRELVRERREWAGARADEGDLVPIRQLAEKGDPWARQQLAEKRDTWALGEIAEKEELAKAARENDPVPHLATTFDAVYLHPVLKLLPEAEEARLMAENPTGFDGRQRVMVAALESLVKQAGQEALAKALTDESFARKAVSESSALRRVLLTHPVVSKQLRAMFRGELDEPDLAPAAGAGASGRRENDHMNDLLRGAYAGAAERGEDERAAGAGAPNGRAAHRDLLADDD